MAGRDEERDTVEGTSRYIPDGIPPYAATPFSDHAIHIGDFKIKEYRGCLRHGVDTRDHKYDVYLIYTYPNAEDIENIVMGCARGCAIAVLITALAAGGSTAAAAISTYVACVSACVRGQVAGSFTCDVRIDDLGRTDWSGH